MALKFDPKLPNLPINSKFLLALIILVGGIIYGYQKFVYGPRKKQIGNLEKELQAIKDSLNFYKQQVADLKRTKEALDSLMAIWVKVQRLLPDEENMPTWFDNIISVSRRAGLAIEEFKPLSPVKSDLYVEYPFELKFKGTYHGLGTFFSFVANAPWITKITSLNISGISSPSSELPVTVEGSCQLSTFVFNPEFLQKSGG